MYKSSFLLSLAKVVVSMMFAASVTHVILVFPSELQEGVNKAFTVVALALSTGLAMHTFLEHYFPKQKTQKKN